MKATAGRIKALQAMAGNGVYVRPDRSVRGFPGYRITPDMEELFRRNKFMEDAVPRDGLLRVWVITDKGREWLSKATMPNVEVRGRQLLGDPS